MDNSIALTIYHQLGGAQFGAMTGAKQFVKHPSALSFKFPRTKGINYCKITLNSMDTYDLELGLIHGHNYKIKHDLKGYYNDMLREAFSTHTGLVLTMPVIHYA